MKNMKNMKKIRNHHASSPFVERQASDCVNTWRLGLTSRIGRTIEVAKTVEKKAAQVARKKRVEKMRQMLTISILLILPERFLLLMAKM